MKNTKRFRQFPLCALVAVASGLSGLAATPATAQTPANAIIVTDINDVMEGKTPKIPAFPKLAKKPGVVRGYVKNAQGKPVAGAKILVATSAFGGFRTSVQGTSDANGYYEAPMPQGVGRVWIAGVGMTYHGVRLALPLHPADGEITDFTSKTGGVENLVLLTYGTANEAGVGDDPTYGGNYYGASFNIGYSTREPDDENAPREWLVLGSDVEITLTPDGPLVGGGAGRPIVIRQKVTPRGRFQVNNVPVGRYQIRARLTQDGKTLPVRLKDNSLGGRKGGMTPTETEDTATIIFRSVSSDPLMLRVPGGGMDRLSLAVEGVK